MHGLSEQTYGELIESPRVDIDMTLAATKAADIGFTIAITGSPNPEQIDAAVRAAESACTAMIYARRRMMALRDEKPPEAQ